MAFIKEISRFVYISQHVKQEHTEFPRTPLESAEPALILKTQGTRMFEMERKHCITPSGHHPTHPLETFLDFCLSRVAACFLRPVPSPSLPPNTPPLEFT